MDMKRTRCAACGHTAHILLDHLQQAHQWTARQYQEQYPDAKIYSPLGYSLVRRYLDQDVTARPHETVTVETLMGWPNEPFEVRRFVGPARWVPPGDDSEYHYDYKATLGLLYALERPRRNAVWLCGYSGTGKTSLVLNLCRKLNREVVRVNLDSSLTRADLLGDWIVRDGATRFVHGLVPQAMRRGAVLLLDEFDLCNPYVLALFRPILEDNPRLVIPEHGGEVITPHPDFRIVATANTWGSGDTTGLYGTTQTLSVADRQRFSLFLHVDYLPTEVEAKLLTPWLDVDEAEQLCKIANAIRAAFAAGSIEESLSPRQLVNWAEVYDAVGSVMQAAKMTFLQPLSESSALAIRQIICDAGPPLVQPHDREAE